MYMNKNRKGANMKKKILIASFFAILMLMLPITTVIGSFSTSGTSSSGKETKYLITFSKEEIKFFGVLLDRVLSGEIKLTENEIVIAKGIRNKIAYEKVELTRDEIRFLLDIFCRITDGEMKLTDYETKILKSIFSKISDAVIGLELSEDKLKNLEGSLDLNNGRIKLTETQITQLEELANSFEDVESRILAQKLVNQLVTAEGELDLAQVKLLFSGDYQIGGIINNLIKKIIQKIADKIMEIMLQLLKERIMNSYREARSGWIYTATNYCLNITIIIGGVKEVTDNIQNDINKIRNAVKAFINFYENYKDLGTLLFLITALIQARGSVKSLWENINNLPETIRSAVEKLYVNITEFTLWFVPDKVDPPNNFTELDRAYNQPIQLNVQILGIESDKMQNVEIDCDYQSYTPSSDGFKEIEFYTSNKAYPYWSHTITLTVTDKNTNPHRTVKIGDVAFSYGRVDINVDFSGRPDKPYGPTYVTRFNIHYYETRAINPSGSSYLCYQWDWGESMGKLVWT